MTALMASALLMMPPFASAQTPAPATAQNPSPMVEATRTHERLTQRDLGGARRAAESNIAMGGPDLMPHRPGQLKTSCPLLREVAAVVRTGIAVQDGNLAEINPATGQRVQVSELVKFATDYLKVDYIFWGTEEPYYSQAVIPFLSRVR